jgi:drug/metabolite transporter (DMT)-like permease
VSIVFFRCLFGALALVLYCWWQGMLKAANFARRNLILATVSGALMVGNWVAFFEAIQRVGISVATVVFHVQPFLVLLIGAMVFGERVTLAKFCWICVGFAGLVLATGLSAAGLAMDASYLFGLACTLFAALLYASATLITKGMSGMRPHLTALIHCVIGALTLSLLVSAPIAGIGAGQWGWLVGLGVIHTAFSYVLVYGALPKLKNVSIAVLAFIYPAAAVAFDFLVYGRALTVLQLCGVALILLAGAGVNLGWSWDRIAGWRLKWSRSVR